MEEFWANFNYLGMIYKNRPKIMGGLKDFFHQELKSTQAFLVGRFDERGAQKVEENESTDSVCVLCQPNKSLPIASRMTYRRCMCSHFNVGTFTE